MRMTPQTPGFVRCARYNAFGNVRSVKTGVDR
ncbi:hypothetical protein NX02_07020 [Sphingomonas sanxanigenens DSM 19645 = NX02]|uniref:Uncharacterized protein n=1 Tax=Sphingomonas sanxanigenens DSM 19645 = NX02 TaxID=1123269 RepID=W0A7Q7_9SPHN|nr:hypothetical protein NX02_07020 [Sphingomonas sanxanigenens DSM 19645 = NX02]